MTPDNNHTAALSGRSLPLHRRTAQLNTVARCAQSQPCVYPRQELSELSTRVYPIIIPPRVYRINRTLLRAPIGSLISIARKK